MSRVLVLHGPNLNLLGTREPEIYGRTTLAEIDARLLALGAELDATVECRQSNHEGVLLDWIHEARGVFDGIMRKGADGGAAGVWKLHTASALIVCGVPSVSATLPA